MPRKMLRHDCFLDSLKCHSSSNPLWFSHGTQDIGTWLNVNPVFKFKSGLHFTPKGDCNIATCVACNGIV